MSPAATLRTTCIQKTCGLLMSGVWYACEENPFSYMPVSVVQDLLSCMWTAESEPIRERIADSRLLLTSGRLECVALSRADDARDYVTPLRMLSRGCQNLRTLIVLWEYSGDRKRDADAERALQEVLQKCAKLEHLRSCIYFTPKDLRNCVNLKVLRLHTGYEETVLFSRSITPDILMRLLSVEEFNFCRGDLGLSKDEEDSVSRAILDNCPQLTSLGCFESSVALKELHDRDLELIGTPRQFNLRSCRWELKWRTLISTSEYRERIRVAALSCPMVEVLVVCVRYADIIRHFGALRNLTSLVMDLYDCVDDYVQEVCCLLEEIGHQLRHLYVHGLWLEPLSVNAICGNCPNLSTLKLHCPLIADEGVQPFVHLPNLERLSVRHSDRKCLFFLLSNCLHLKVLSMRDCKQFEDGALQTIIEKNPFAQLEVAVLDGCSLSEWGWRRFLQSAPKLTGYYFFQLDLLGRDEAKRCVRDLNPSAHSVRSYSEVDEEQFPLDVDSSCWL